MSDCYTTTHDADQDLPTLDAMALAYSEDQEIQEIPQPASWSSTWSRAALVFVAAGAVTGVAALGLMMLSSDERNQSPVASAPTSTVTPQAAPAPSVTTTVTAAPPPPPVTVTVTPQAIPTVAPPTKTAVPPTASVPSTASSRDKDAAFFFQLSRGGIIVTDAQQATDGAHAVCTSAAAGESDYDQVRDSMRNNPTLSLDQAWTFVIAAKTSYCPELGR